MPTRPALLAVVAALALSAPPAGAVTPRYPWGALCGTVLLEDPQVEYGYSGVVLGGPVTLDGDTAAAVPITCTIQVNAPTHGGADGCSVSGTNVAFGFCTVALFDDFDNVYVCTSAELPNGTTVYFDEPSNPLARGEWSTSTSARCGLATMVYGPCPDVPCDDVLRAVCPILAAVSPPEGDVSPVVDCPPYGGYSVPASNVVVKVPTFHAPPESARATG
jgi:hypothetical protein